MTARSLPATRQPASPRPPVWWVIRFAEQDLDGVVYQEVPQPEASGNSRVARSAAEYGYKDGGILGNSGHLRIAVSTTQTKVEYIGADEAVSHSCVVPFLPRHSEHVSSD